MHIPVLLDFYSRPALLLRLFYSVPTRVMPSKTLGKQGEYVNLQGHRKSRAPIRAIRVIRGSLKARLDSS